MPLVWIPATLCVGLLIATVYLGGRILTAHSHALAAVQAPTPVPAPVPVQTTVAVQAPVPVQTSVPVQPTPTPAPTAPTVTAAIPIATVQANPEPEAPKLEAYDQVPMITPREGERYIQVGALDLESTERYIPRLRQAKLEPHVAPGPKPELLRVLIGPFADQDSLAGTKSQLDHAGIPNFIRKY
jgi:cell division septation protein DedD